MATTLQMAMGRLVLERIVRQPGRFPDAVMDKAKDALQRLHYWEVSSDQAARWNTGSESWLEFKQAVLFHGIDLPEILNQ